MTERVQRRKAAQQDQSTPIETQTAQPRTSVDYDALLDQIDAVLESDAEEYVRSFVQKGGQ
ncbi:MAG: ubiquitin-like protein Pup [Micropruina sp.]|nr:ubiquitin-like protein Pup [Micropruina sp.]